MDDEKLMVLIKTRPADGLRAAVGRYGGKVRAAAVRVLGGSPDTDECVADAFYKLWKCIDEGKMPGNPGAYAAAVSRNAALDILKSRKPETPLDDAVLEADFDLENEYARAENARIVRESVDSLPEPDRLVFFRRYYYGEREVSFEYGGLAELWREFPQPAQEDFYYIVYTDEMVERRKRFEEESGISILSQLKKDRDGNYITDPYLPDSGLMLPFSPDYPNTYIAAMGFWDDELHMALVCSDKAEHRRLSDTGFQLVNRKTGEGKVEYHAILPAVIDADKVAGISVSGHEIMLKN